MKRKKGTILKSVGSFHPTKNPNQTSTCAQNANRMLINSFDDDAYLWITGESHWNSHLRQRHHYFWKFWPGKFWPWKFWPTKGSAVIALSLSMRPTRASSGRAPLARRGWSAVAAAIICCRSALKQHTQGAVSEHYDLYWHRQNHCNSVIFPRDL